MPNAAPTDAPRRCVARLLGSSRGHPSAAALESYYQQRSGRSETGGRGRAPATPDDARGADFAHDLEVVTLHIYVLVRGWVVWRALVEVHWDTPESA